MSIEYVCKTCAKELGLSGFEAENECGRKACANCGTTNAILVVDLLEYEAAAEQKSLPNEKEARECLQRVVDFACRMVSW